MQFKAYVILAQPSQGRGKAVGLCVQPRSCSGASAFPVISRARIPHRSRYAAINDVAGQSGQPVLSG